MIFTLNMLYKSYHKNVLCLYHCVTPTKITHSPAEDAALEAAPCGPVSLRYLFYCHLSSLVSNCHIPT